MSQPHSHSHPHTEHHFEASDIVIGMADGLTVPFALAAGISGAAVGIDIIVTASVAEIAAGSIAMALAATWPGARNTRITMPSASGKNRKYATCRIANARK